MVDKMTRINKINEQQYRKLLLNETMHYPEFLDKLKEFENENKSIYIL